MASSYPAATKSFTTKLPNDTIASAHMNAVQDEIVALENALRTGLEHDLKFTDATYDLGKSGATRPRDLFLSRNADIGGDVSVVGNLTVAAMAATLIFTSDATFDLGAPGAHRPRDLHLSRDLLVGDQIFERGRSVALGEWTTPTFAAGDFTTDAGTWGVAAATTFQYTLVGLTMTLNFNVTGTTTGAPTNLRLLLPASKATAARIIVPVFYTDAGGAVTAGYADLNPAVSSGTLLQIFKTTGAAFSAGAGTAVFGSVTFAVSS